MYSCILTSLYTVRWLRLSVASELLEEFLWYDLCWVRIAQEVPRAVKWHVIAKIYHFKMYISFSLTSHQGTFEPRITQLWSSNLYFSFYGRNNETFKAFCSFRWHCPREMCIQTSEEIIEKVRVGAHTKCTLSNTWHKQSVVCFNALSPYKPCENLFQSFINKIMFYILCMTLQVKNLFFFFLRARSTNYTVSWTFQCNIWREVSGNKSTSSDKPYWNGYKFSKFQIKVFFPYWSSFTSIYLLGMRLCWC